MKFSAGVLLAMIFLYVVSPAVLWALFCRLLGAKPGERRYGFVAALSVAPILIGILITFAYRRFPDRGDTFYLMAPVVVILAIAIFCRRELADVPKALRSSFCAFRDRLSPAKGGLIAICMAGFVLAGGVRAVQNTLTTAILDTDALEYAAVGRHIERKESLKFYPMLKADDRTGFYTPCTHPPTYPSLLCWNYIAQGDNWSFGYGRLLGLWALASMTLSILYLTRRQPVHLSLLAVLAMYSCPALFSEFSNMSIDPLYLAPFLGSLVVIVETLNAPMWRNAVLTGVMLGCLGSVHSIGLYLFGVVAGVAFLMIQTTWKHRFLWASLACSVGLALCANTYIRNLRLRGRPIGDDVAVWELKVVSFQDFMREERGLVTMSDRLVRGVLRVWHEAGNYGPLPWIFALALLIMLKRNGRQWRRWPEPLQVMLLAFSLYYSGIVLSWLAGMDLLIKNFRYQIPLVLMMAAAIPFLISYQGFVGAISAQHEPRLFWLIRKSTWTALYALIAYLFLSGTADNLTDGWVKKFALPKDTRMARESTYGALVALRKFEADATSASKLLSFSTNYPAFYSKKPILSELDPVMGAFYNSKSMDEALGFLRKHGVTHILATPYYWPTFDRTIAKRILEDEEVCTVIAESDGWRLAKLLP